MKNKIIFYTLCCIGIAHRFYYQFIKPSYNVDEISLGLNIKNSNYLELLKPMPRGQSAPPLYLWVQKSIIQLPFSSWVNFKILSFLVSSLSLIVFLKFIKKWNYNILFIIPFVILLFNPYVIYNSLTLKQYTFDLLGMLILITFFETPKFIKLAALFFLIWSFFSNVAIFACTGLLLHLFASNYYTTLKEVPIKLRAFIKDKALVLLSLVPYIIYFFWFMSQPGAHALKQYMTKYWADSFMPLNINILKYWVYQLNGFLSFFFTMNKGVALFLFISSFGIFAYQLKEKKQIAFKSEMILCLYIFIVHLILNVFQLYPLSDRLYLYLIVPFILFLISSAYFAVNQFKLNQLILTVVLTLSLFISYTSYFLYKENDVKSVYDFVNIKKEKSIYLTQKAMHNIVRFNKLTDRSFLNNIKLYHIDSSLGKSKYLISRFHKKMNPNKNYKEEQQVLSLLANNDIKLVQSFDGYNVYEVLNN